MSEYQFGISSACPQFFPEILVIFFAGVFYAVLCIQWNINFVSHIRIGFKNFFDELSAKLSEVIRNSPAKDIEKNARALLMQGFAKLDLITREEFDVQAQLLTLTREQLVLLEMRVAQLEAQRNTAAE